MSPYGDSADLHPRRSLGSGLGKCPQKGSPVACRRGRVLRGAPRPEASARLCPLRTLLCAQPLASLFAGQGEQMTAIGIEAGPFKRRGRGRVFRRRVELHEYQRQRPCAQSLWRLVPSLPQRGAKWLRRAPLRPPRPGPAPGLRDLAIIT